MSNTIHNMSNMDNNAKIWIITLNMDNNAKIWIITLKSKFKVR